MVRWEQLASPDIAGLLAGRPTEVGLLPVGATEQHGPHLPTGTDTVIAVAVAEEVSRRTGAPVLPPVAVGCSFGHGDVLPGTLSADPGRFVDLVRDTVEWSARSGLRRVLAVNAHFGNDAALSMAGDYLRLGRPDLRFGVTNWWACHPEVAVEAAADGPDFHANRAETALMLAVAPHLVRADRLGDADDPDRTAGLVFRYTAPSLSRNGVTGRPSEATAGLGRALFGRVVAAVTDQVRRGREEVAPLGGR